MEILFFRYANRLAGLFTKYVDEVIHAPETFPSLPVSPHITDMIVHREVSYGIIDLKGFISAHDGSNNPIIILVGFEGISFGIKINKIVQVRSVSKTKLVSIPDKASSVSPEIVDCACRVKNNYIPILSPEKLLHHPDIEPLWYNGVNSV